MCRAASFISITVILVFVYRFLGKFILLVKIISPIKDTVLMFDKTRFDFAAQKVASSIATGAFLGGAAEISAG